MQKKKIIHHRPKSPAYKAELPPNNQDSEARPAWMTPVDDVSSVPTAPETYPEDEYVYSEPPSRFVERVVSLFELVKGDRPEVGHSILPAIALLSLIKHRKIDLPSELAWSSLKMHSDSPAKIKRFVSTRLLPAFVKLPARKFNSKVARDLAVDGDLDDLRGLVWKEAVNLVDSSNDCDLFERALAVVVHLDPAMRRKVLCRDLELVLIALANPRVNERIHDPFSRFGETLLQAHDWLSNTNQDLQLSGEFGGKTDISGCESSKHSYLISSVRQILHSSDAHLACRDAASKQSPDGAYDCIFSVLVPHDENPPKASDLVSFELRRLRTIMSSLAADGRAVVVVSDGLLTPGASSPVTKRLLEEFRVEVILSLPELALRPYSDTKASILYFSKATPQPKFWLHRLHTANDSCDLTGAIKKWVSGKKIWDTWLISPSELSDRLAQTAKASWSLEIFVQELLRRHPQLKVSTLGELADVLQGNTIEPEKESFKSCLVLAPWNIPENGAQEMGASGPYEAGIDPILCDTARLPLGVSSVTLIANDIVVSASGRIGKACVVAHDDIEGAHRFTAHHDISEDWVASPGILVIRSKGVDAYYLRRLLQSWPYQEFLSGEALGYSNPILPIEALKSLPIPIPPEQHGHFPDMQLKPKARVEELIRAFDHSLNVERASSFLFTDTAISQLLSEAEIDYDPSRWKEVLRLLTIVFGRNRSYDLQKLLPEGSSLLNWVQKATELCEKLLGTLEVTLAERHHVLTRLASFVENLEQATESLAADPSLWDRTTALTKIFRRLVIDEKDRIENWIQLDIGLDRTSVLTGQTAELNVYLENQGPIPLFDVIVETMPPSGPEKLPILPPGKPYSWPISITQPILGLNQVTLKIGITMPCGKTVQFSDLYFLGKEQPITPDSIGRSPYVVGMPVPGDEDLVFKGHADTIDRIVKRLLANRTPWVFLLGPRRSGKTSLLNRLSQASVLPVGWIPVYLSMQALQSADGRSRGSEFLHAIFSALAVTLYRSGIEFTLKEFGDISSKSRLSDLSLALRSKIRLTSSDSGAFEDFQTCLNSLLASVPTRRFLLLFDDIDQLNADLKSGFTSPVIIQQLHSLLTEKGQFSAVFAASLTPIDLNKSHWAPFSDVQESPVLIAELEAAAARELLESPVSGRIWFTPGTSDRVLYLTGCQAHLLQIFADALFHVCEAASNRIVTPRLVDECAQAISKNLAYFTDLWEHIDTPNGRYMTWILAKQPECQPVALDVLLQEARSHGLNYPLLSRLKEDMQRLCELGVINILSKDPTPLYALKIPLLRNWILMGNIDLISLRSQARHALNNELV